MRNKILSLLVLLLTAASGAWATDDVLLTTVTATGMSTYSQSPDGVVTVVISGNDNYYEDWGWYRMDEGTGTITVTAAEGYTITRCVFKQYPSEYPNRVLEDDLAPFVMTFNGAGMGEGSSFVETSNGQQYVGGMDGASVIEVYGTAPDAIEVTPGSSANIWTFSMPGSDVVMTPQYAPVAEWTKVENVEQLPAALEGIIAGQDTAIVTEGQSAQGTVMYAVTTTAEAAPALTAFSATVPTAKDYDDATTLYVWYYIQGQDTPDGQQATEENTFNDTEICATPLKVDILTNKFDLTLSPAPVKNITVTVAGQAKTPTDEGKVEAVKMQSEVKLKAATGYKFRKVEVKKGEAAPALKTINIGGTILKYADGETWGEAITNHATENTGWNIQIVEENPNIFHFVRYNENRVYCGSAAVQKDDPIDASETYEF